MICPKCKSKRWIFVACPTESDPTNIEKEACHTCMGSGYVLDERDDMLEAQGVMELQHTQNNENPNEFEPPVAGMDTTEQYDYEEIDPGHGYN